MKSNKKFLQKGIMAALFIGLMMFSMGLVSANTSAFTKDDTTSKYGRIDINNDNIITNFIHNGMGLRQLMPSNQIATYELTNNTDECFIDCSAEGTATLYNDGQLFTDLNFKDKSGRDISISNAKIYLLKEDTTEVPDWKQQCSKEYIAINGSITKDCKAVQTGTHEETSSSWELYNGEDLSAGDYTWKIEANIPINSKVDWIASATDRTPLAEWAWWNSSWADKKLITLTGSGVPINYSLFMYVDKATDMNADFSDIRFVDNAETTSIPYWIEAYNATTATVWVKVQNNNTFYMYYGNAGATSAANIKQAFIVGVDWRTESSLAGTGFHTVGSGCVVGFQSGLNLTACSWTTGGLKTDYNFSLAQLPLVARNLNWTYTQYNIGVWDISTRAGLSDTTTTFYAMFRSDPAYNIGYDSGVVTANFPATSTKYDVVHILYTNTSQGANLTRDTQSTLIRNRTGLTAEVAPFEYGFGSYSSGFLNIQVTQIMPYMYNRPTYTFGAETLLAGMTIVNSYPADKTNSSLSSITFACNATGSGFINVTSIVLKVNGTATWNQSVTAPAGQDSYNATFINATMTDGDYSWNCTVYGSKGYNASTSKWTLTKDNSVPVINLLLPTGDNYIQSQNLNFSYTEAHPGSCWYNLNNATSNVTIAGCLNTTLNLSVGNNTLVLYANDSFGNTASPSVGYPYLYPTLGLCNTTLNIPYLNVTFTDEITLAKVLASLSPSQIIYYKDVNMQRTYTFSNATANPSYNFCVTPGESNITAITSLIAYNTTNYPSRQSQFTNVLNNVTTNKSMLLLSSTSGTYVTFQILTSGLSGIAGAIVNATTAASGLVASAATDTSGVVTFFLNPNIAHTINVLATGFALYTTIITPTQAAYTIILGGSTGATNISTNSTNYFGVYFLPNNAVDNDTSYNFIFAVNGTQSFSSMNFTLYNDNQTQIGTGSAGAGINNQITITANTKSNSTLLGVGCYVATGTMQCYKYQWIVINVNGQQYSLFNAFNDISSYLNGSGLFGLKTGFAMNLVIFFIIFIITGAMAYQFGLYNPTAVAGIIFVLTFLFDAVLGLVANPPLAVPHFATFITGIALVGLVIKEATGY